MTHIDLKPNEFIIKLDENSSEQIKLQLINPHSPREFDNASYQLLKLLFAKVTDNLS